MATKTRSSSRTAVPVQDDASEAQFQAWMVAFGLRLRDARIKAGLTQDEVSARLSGSTGEAQAYISKIELGRINLTARTMARLSEIVGADLDALVCPTQATPLRHTG
jgi:transcriptional regulator with XRE-family HTH domain